MSLRERLAIAQFEAEGHTSRGIPLRWENLPVGNREHRLGWADRVIDALDLDDADDDEPVNYTGPDQTVSCAYPPCTNRLRMHSDYFDPRFPEKQWCSRWHRRLTGL